MVTIQSKVQRTCFNSILENCDIFSYFLCHSSSKIVSTLLKCPQQSLLMLLVLSKIKNDSLISRQISINLNFQFLPKDDVRTV